VEPAWQYFINREGTSPNIYAIGLNFLRNHGNHIPRNKVNDYLKETSKAVVIIDSSFQQSVDNLHRLLAMTVFGTHGYFYNYLVSLLQQLARFWTNESKELFGDLNLLDSSHVNDLEKFISREFLSNPDEIIIKRTHDNPYNVLIESLQRNKAKIQRLNCSKFYNTSTVQLIVRLFQNLFQSNIELENEINDTFGEQQDYINPVLFTDTRRYRKYYPLSTFGESGSFGKEILKKLDSLNRPTQKDRSLIGRPYQRVQLKLFYAGIRTELISEHVKELMNDFQMNGENKSENLKDRIQMLCTKRIIPIDIASNKYDVDPRTIREISFEEVEPRQVKPIFKGEGESAIFVPSETELRQKTEDRIVSFAPISPFPIAVEKIENKNNDFILPILGFVTVASAIYAFN